MKRKLAFLLAVLMIFGVSAACAANPVDGMETKSETAAESETLSEQITEDVPEKDYSGASFRVLVRPGSYIKEFYVESDTGDVVDTAVFNRNRTIEERFNIEFEFNESSHFNYETDAQKTITAGDDAYELVLPHARAATMYGQEDLLISWYDLEYVNLEKPWWNQNVVEQFTLYDKLYCMTGSLSYLSLGMSFGMFFNKNLFDDMNIAYPYETVNANTWTFDKLAETALKSSKDLNGDGVISMSDDQFGYTTHDWHGCMNVLWAQGGSVSGKDNTDELVLTLSNERTVDIFSRYFELLADESSYVMNSEKTGQYSVEIMFGEGRSAFLEFSLISMETLRSYETVEFGVVPSPKYDESQENYITMMNAATSLFCVPITVSDTEYISIILEAWSAESYRVTIPAYFDIALKTKYSRDDDSAAMLDLILKISTVDLVYYSNNFDPLSSVGYKLFHDTNHNFSSFYKSNEKPSQKKLEKIIEAYGG